MFRELNKRFLGRDESESITSLTAQYESLMANLIALRKKINAYSQTTRCFLNENDIRGLMERWPSMELSRSGDGCINLKTMRTPISFYTERWDEDSQYIYTTFPLHSFAAKFTNHKPDVTSEHNTYGHPHCRLNGRRFISICTGSNEFMRLYENPRITRDMVIFMLDSMMLWFTTTNLSDMYGTCLTRERPTMPDIVESWHDESEELFALAQKREAQALHQKLVDMGACNINGGIDDYDRCFLNDFIFAYALWLRHHPNARYGCTSGKECLNYAIRQDIAYYMSRSRFESLKQLETIRERIFAGPSKLLRHARRHEYRNAALEQIIE